MPEKLPTKVIVELEGGEGGATDMAGDAGVVGRWLVQDSGGAQPQLQLDLKGVLYNASLVPCATTLCVVALGAGEARVEALASEFMQLREVPTAAAQGPDGGAGGDEAEMADLFLFDDDDTYQPGEVARDGEGKPQAAGSKRKAKAAAGGAAPAKKPRPAAKPGARGAKKPAKPSTKKPPATKRAKQG
ncbi:hypothetical protein WJX81_000027 [Elliptochloris bilobata]|uniref:Uncharacterized protein n=1 Tax=Elliptochloris bilobata TaxID=381761 RepID=A0AAW1RNC1_9CHLO